MDAIKIVENENVRFSIFQDVNALDPLDDFDHEERMVCFHRRYRLGDDHNYRQDDYSSWAELKRAILRDNKGAVILPLYLYDHSGITISTTSFNDRWDSGQVGFIYLTKEGMKKYYGESMPRYWRKRADEILLGAVKTYDDYLTGNVYGFKIERKVEGEWEKEDSCWGFIGDIETSGIMDEMPSELKEKKGA